MKQRAEKDNAYQLWYDINSNDYEILKAFQYLTFGQLLFEENIGSACTSVTRSISTRCSFILVNKKDRTKIDTLW